MPDGDWYDLWSDEDYDMVILDEYKGMKTLQFLHSWCQEARMSLNRRGISPVIKKKHIPTLFLSNFSPEQTYHKIFDKNPSDLDPLKRRLIVVEITEEIKLPFK